MNIQADIKWIEKELREIKDPAFIEIIKSMLQYRKKTIQSEELNIEQYNRELEEAEQEIEKGNFYTTEEIRKISSQWGRK